MAGAKKGFKMRILSVTTAAAALLIIMATGLAQTASVPRSRAHHLAIHRIQGPVARPAHAAARYIVRFKAAPVPLYTGGIEGFKANSPHTAGVRRLNMRAPQTIAYARYLESHHSEFLHTARTALGRTIKPHFQYRYALNGMSVSLSRSEAAKLASLSNVVAVVPVHYYRLTAAIPATAADTAASRAWIGAPDIWSLSTGIEGEGIVVADLDGGINSGNSSFAAIGPKDGYAVQNPLGSGNYLGVCDPGNVDQSSKKPDFFNCNDKLIGAYTYISAAENPNSPEDADGHGSHTASTIAGNLVDASFNGVAMPISGIAPHANIIAYDICDSTGSCGSDDAVAAIDQAIQDYSKLSKTAGFKGMVLNYSIGGGEVPYGDPVAQAFLSAVEAGIYVSAAAGNGGPGNAFAGDPTLRYPVEHRGPWVASTAASTHDGTFSANNLKNFLGGDLLTQPLTPMTGAGITGGYGPANIVYAGDGSYVYSPYPGTLSTASTYALSGEPYADPGLFTAAQAASECLYPFTPATTFASGTIVVCKRGDIALVDKVDNAKHGGAAAVVITTTATSAQNMPAISYEIPATLIDRADGDKLLDWLTASTGIGTVQAQLSGALPAVDPAQADQIASFSSRGPTGTVYDNLIKPDLVAPGVNVLAAVANPAYTDGGGPDQPETYAFFNGTSMASPHDAGAAALLMQLHPSWTPPEIKSALMLTAVTATLRDQCASLDTGNNCVAGAGVPSPLVRGAGRIDVALANRTGIVLDETSAHFEAADPNAGGDLTTLNLPSLANNDCVATCRWTRTLSSALTSTTAQYSATVSGATDGLDLAISPALFTLAPGTTQILTVTANVSALPVQQWAFAQIDIASTATGDDGLLVPPMHLPVAVKPQPPRPSMSVSPQALAITVAQHDSAATTLTINNAGPGNLDWALASGGSSPSIAMWDQPNAGTQQGVPSLSLSPDGHGIYSADRFVMPADGIITKIFTDGFAQTSDTLVDLQADATAIDWFIYADAGGQPAGNPDEGFHDYRWHSTAPPNTPGVTITNAGAITLDLTAAGWPPVALDAGTYWLIVSPTFNAGADDPDGPAWFWFEGNSPGGDKSALLIDSGNTFGQGTDWLALDTSLAFTLTGTLDCSGTGLDGLGFSESSGTVASGAASNVNITFDAATAAVGADTAPVCVTGNDPAHPLIAVPLTVTVESPPPAAPSKPADNGGGGGAFGLLAALWLLAAGAAVKSRRS